MATCEDNGSATGGERDKPAKRKRRFGTAGSATRDVILDATERVLVELGYGAVTTRRVAERGGLKAPLVHYYYKTTDDLLLATYRRGAERSLQRHAEAMAVDNPLRALWEVNTDPDRTALALEFMALANRHPTIRAEIGLYAEQIRAIEHVAISRYLRAQPGAEPFSPMALTVILAAVARGLVMEAGVGIALGHAETQGEIDALLVRLSQSAASPVPAGD